MERVVIAGAGHAGVQVADSLRARVYDGAITVMDHANQLASAR